MEILQLLSIAILILVADDDEAAEEAVGDMLIDMVEDISIMVVEKCWKISRTGQSNLEYSQSKKKVFSYLMADDHLIAISLSEL